MNALQTLRIQKAAGVTDYKAAIKIIAGHGIPAAIGQRFCAVANELSAFQNVAHEGMRFPGLKCGVGIETRIFIFKRNDQPDRNAIVAEAINPAATVHFGGERPAERVRDIAGLNFAGLNVPEFLDADSVALWINVVEMFSGDELFGERAARAFGKNRYFGAEFVAWRVVIFGLAVFVEALIFRDDPGDAFVFVD